MTISEFLERLSSVTGAPAHLSGNGSCSTRCPAHDDRNASLSVSLGRDDRILLKCHAGDGCTTQQIVEAVGLEPRDLFATNSNDGRPQHGKPGSGKRAKGHPPKPRIESIYPYHAGGKVVFEVVRYAPKGFRQRRPDGGGGYVWNLNGVERVLYRLPALIAAVRDGVPIYVCEGERDVASVVKAGGVATCNPGGAGKWQDSYSETLRGATRVNVIADRDEAGRTHARAVAESLRGVVDEVVVLEPVEGKDVTDHLAAGHTLEELRQALAVSAPTLAAVGAPGLAAILDQCVELSSRYIGMAPADHDTCALFAAHTWVFPAWSATPYLNLSSPEKECGKTSLGILIGKISREPFATVSASGAALYRTIAKKVPTLIMDELDQGFKGNKERVAEILEIVNAGYSLGMTVPKCVPPKWEVAEFSVFCPKVLIGIGELPDTTASRTIRLVLQRKPRGSVERFRDRRVRQEAEPIRAAFQAWADAVDMDALADAEWPEDDFPEELGDRQCDIWEPLLLLATMAGDEWRERALKAARIVGAGSNEVEGDSYFVRMLGAVRAAFDEDAATELPTRDLILRMASDEESPWAKWAEERDGDQRPVKGVPEKLSKGMRRFGVKSRKWRAGDRTIRGYQRDDFERAFAAYLPPSDDSTRHTRHNPHGYAENEGSPTRHNPASVAGSEHAANPHGYVDVAGVAGRHATQSEIATNGDGAQLGLVGTAKELCADIRAQLESTDYAGIPRPAFDDFETACMAAVRHGGAQADDAIGQLETFRNAAMNGGAS